MPENLPIQGVQKRFSNEMGTLREAHENGGDWESGVIDIYKLKNDVGIQSHKRYSRKLPRFILTHCETPC